MTAAVVEVNEAQCIELLRSERVGRLGVVVRGRPDIFPVNYWLDASDSVVIRTAFGTKLVAAVNHYVAFEVDRFDVTGGRWGWSVVVHGVAHQTSSVAVGDRPLVSLRGEGHELMRISHSSVTGRRIERQPPQPSEKLTPGR